LSRRRTYRIGNKEIIVEVGSNLAHALTEFLLEKKFCKLFLLSNETVFPLWGTKIMRALANAGFEVEKIIVKDGEQYKNLETVKSILKQLILSGAERTSILISLGGGVITDIGGFTASILLRGIPVIHYPTTLLSQVDAALGGKTGVDFYGFKNMVGSFYQPDAIFCDLKTLTTLENKQISNAMAEIIKYALTGEEVIYDILHKNNPDNVMTVAEELVDRSVNRKLGIVAEDEKEAGKRELLNFGHTFGHAVESASSFKLLHGQAVAIGMSFALFYSMEKGYITREWFGLAEKLIESYGLKTSIPPEIKIDDIFDFMAKDKKRRGGNLRFVFAKGKGAVVEDAGNIKNVIDRFIIYKTDGLDKR